MKKKKKRTEGKEKIRKERLLFDNLITPTGDKPSNNYSNIKYLAFVSRRARYGLMNKI